MPNKMDLEDIKNYLKGKAGTGAVWGLNLFAEEPENFCENRQPSVNENIQISIIKPQWQWSFAKKMQWFTVLDRHYQLKKWI